MKLLKTGIAGLDEFLRGGLPPSVLLLVGEPGSGIEVFAREVAFKRAHQTGVSYLTLNKTKDHIREEMSAFRLDTTQLEDSGNWRFISPSPNETIEEIVKKEISQRRSIVIDSLSDILLNVELDEVIHLLKTMSSQNRQILELHLVLLTKGMHGPKTETIIQHFADGVIEFTTTWGAEFVTRRMFIKKLGGAVTPIRSLSYLIGEKGITIETAIRIT
jgi:KaiC/GvpD/RAD55 family RecA-like ATPase